MVIIRFVPMLAMLAVCTPAVAQNASEYPLFADDAALDLRISAPFQAIWRDNEDDETDYDATLEYVDPSGASVAIDIDVRLRGLSRRLYCEVPPLRLDFPRSRVDGTVFAGQNRIKLVTMCDDERRYDDYVIQEYLIYRALNLLTDWSFKVRRANVEYVLTDTRRNRPQTSPGFLIEADWAVAERLGLDVIETEKVELASLDPEYTALITLFQFLIGNTDWSVQRGPSGDDCCHNGKVFGTEGGPFIVVPYDFDSSGLVNAEYAAPTLRQIRTVRQRLYRGFCSLKPNLDQAIATINGHRDELFELFDSDLLTEPTRRSNASYLEQFFSVIDDPDRREAQLGRRARGDCED